MSNNAPQPIKLIEENILAPNGMISWIETFHESSLTFHSIIREENTSASWLRNELIQSGSMLLPSIIQDFTNHFENAYKTNSAGAPWDELDWIATVESCVNEYAKTGKFEKKSINI